MSTLKDKLIDDQTNTTQPAPTKGLKVDLLSRKVGQDLKQKVETEKQEQEKYANFAKKALAANLDNPDKFSKNKIEYFQGSGLVPQRLQVSGRYIAILFEAADGMQEYHVINRYTHDLVMREQHNRLIKNFYLYDPFDCARYHKNKKSMAYTITLLNKIDENGDQSLVFSTVIEHNKSFQADIESEGGQWATFAACSADLRYAAVALLMDENQADHGGVDGYNKLRISFFSVMTGIQELKLLSTTDGAIALNPTWIDASVIFLQNEPKALVGYIKNYIALVDVVSGSELSRFNITAANIELVYYQDTEKYGLIQLDDSKTFTIGINEDKLKLEEEKPLAFFDAKNSAGLCTQENPYKFSMKLLNGSYNKSQTTGFIINQKFFNLTMNDIRFSRVQVQPGVKVFYAIKNTAPYTCHCVDLSNLDIFYQASLLDCPDAIVQAYHNGLTSTIVIDDASYKKLIVSKNVKSVVSLSQFVVDRIPSLNLDHCSFFEIQDQYLIIKVTTNIEIYDLGKNCQVFQAFGLRATLSEDKQALILNKGAYQFQVWRRNSNGQFQPVVQSFKNVTQRVDFIPKSSTKVALYDELLKGLLSFDTITGQYEFLVANAEFTSNDYNFIDDKLLYYKIRELTGATNTYIFNYVHGFLEQSKGLEGNVLLIQQSISGKYLYATTEDSVKVYDKENLTVTVQEYPVSQVFKIKEFGQSTILCSKAQRSINVIQAGDLEPNNKIDDETSSKFLMRYIFDTLQNKESGVQDQLFAIDVYAQFMSFGYVDTFFDEEGTTLLHSLIKDYSVEIFSRLFHQPSGPITYKRRFDGVSPLVYAVELSKMQHVKVMLDYFAEHPDEIQLSHDDFLCLMQLGLPEAKVIIYHQFKEPVTYKAQLPFQVNCNDELFIEPSETFQLGKKQVEAIESQINHKGQEAQLYSYSMSKFKYNFTRGSHASLEFLRAYADEEDEHVLRSKLRLIVDQKFSESMPYLLTLAGIFYVFLGLYLYAIVAGEVEGVKGTALLVGLMLLNTFFFLLELRQAYKDGWEYLTDFWNYIDLSVFLTNYFLFNYPYEITGLVAFVYSVACFLMLLRGMSYLRIFGSLRYLINMVIEIIKDMSAFTILLIYWCLGYCFIFYVVAGPSDAETLEEPQLISHMKEVYRLAYGDFAPDDYDTAQWLAFIIATFFLPLVMLNMVIALMGDTFGRVKEEQAKVDMKEKARMIIEAETFASFKVPHTTDEEEAALRKHIFIGYCSEIAEDDFKVEQPSKAETLIGDVFNAVTRIEETVKSINSFKDDIISEIQDLKKRQE